MKVKSKRIPFRRILSLLLSLLLVIGLGAGFDAGSVCADEPAEQAVRFRTWDFEDEESPFTYLSATENAQYEKVVSSGGEKKLALESYEKSYKDYRGIRSGVKVTERPLRVSFDLQKVSGTAGEFLFSPLCRVDAGTCDYFVQLEMGTNSDSQFKMKNNVSTVGKHCQFQVDDSATTSSGKFPTYDSGGNSSVENAAVYQVDIIYDWSQFNETGDWKVGLTMSITNRTDTYAYQCVLKHIPVESYTGDDSNYYYEGYGDTTGFSVGYHCKSVSTCQYYMDNLCMTTYDTAYTTSGDNAVKNYINGHVNTTDSLLKKDINEYTAENILDLEAALNDFEDMGDEEKSHLTEINQYFEDIYKNSPDETFADIQAVKFHVWDFEDGKSPFTYHSGETAVNEAVVQNTSGDYKLSLESSNKEFADARVIRTGIKATERPLRVSFSLQKLYKSERVGDFYFSPLCRTDVARCDYYAFIKTADSTLTMEHSSSISTAGKQCQFVNTNAKTITGTAPAYSEDDTITLNEAKEYRVEVVYDWSQFHEANEWKVGIIMSITDGTDTLTVQDTLDRVNSTDNAAFYNNYTETSGFSIGYHNSNNYDAPYYMDNLCMTTYDTAYTAVGDDAVGAYINEYAGVSKDSLLDQDVYSYAAEEYEALDAALTKYEKLTEQQKKRLIAINGKFTAAKQQYMSTGYTPELVSATIKGEKDVNQDVRFKATIGKNIPSGYKPVEYGMVIAKYNDVYTTQEIALSDLVYNSTSEHVIVATSTEVSDDDLGKTFYVNIGGLHDGTYGVAFVVRAYVVIENTSDSQDQRVYYSVNSKEIDGAAGSVSSRVGVENGYAARSVISISKAMLLALHAKNVDVSSVVTIQDGKITGYVNEDSDVTNMPEDTKKLFNLIIDNRETLETGSQTAS